MDKELFFLEKQVNLYEKKAKNARLNKRIKDAEFYEKQIIIIKNKLGYFQCDLIY